VKIHKLATSPAFVVIDLDGAETSVGVVRAANKILQAGAVALARSTTYTLASLERRAGGAAAGISAESDARPGAIAAFVAEVAELAPAHGLVLDPGAGVDAAALEPLAGADPRGTLHRTAHDGVPLAVDLTALGAASAADVAVGGLDGRTVALEGAGPVAGPLAAELVARGARIVALSGPGGVAIDAAGLDPEAVRRGGAAVATLTSDPAPAAALFGAEADVIFCGSRQGMLDGDVAEALAARVVVPTGCQPLSAKGLAVLRRRGVVALPDFLTTAGPAFAWWPTAGATVATVRAAADEGIATLVGEVLDAEDGPLLGACYRAEAFLRTWRDELPFGRPLA